MEKWKVELCFSGKGYFWRIIFTWNMNREKFAVDFFLIAFIHALVKNKSRGGWGQTKTCLVYWHHIFMKDLIFLFRSYFLCHRGRHAHWHVLLFAFSFHSKTLWVFQSLLVDIKASHLILILILFEICAWLGEKSEWNQWLGTWEIALIFCIFWISQRSGVNKTRNKCSVDELDPG